jgi:PBSX family phage terminase large subunit
LSTTSSNVTPLSQCIGPSFYELHKAFKEEKYTEYWLRGGRGSTKSSFLSIEVVLSVINDPEANVVIFRRYENEIRDTVFGQLQWAVAKLGVDHLFKVNVSPFKLTYEPTGQMILFKGADNPKKLKSIKLAKGYLKIGWWEECDQFSGMDEIRNIQQSIFRGTQKKQIALFSYNPPKSARSWVNEESKIQKPGRIVHYSDYRDVPKDWLGDTFLANAEHLKETNEEAYKHEYLGEETGTGLEVFNNVTLRKISKKEISQFDHRFQGLDFGYAADPLCFLAGHFDAKKRRLYLYREISGIGIKNSQLAQMLTDEERADVTMADSAEPKSVDELREEHKVNVVPVDKYPGSVEHGIKYMQDLEQIVIDPERCPLAATEFINYALNTDRYGEVISKYPDKGNHSIDAARYLLAQQIKADRIERRKSKFKARPVPVLSRWGK